MKRKAIALLLAAGVGAFGCDEKTGGGASGPGPSGPYVTKFRIGRVVASDGVVTVETDSFHQGDPIHVSFEVKNVPSSSLIKVVWSGSSKETISEEQKQPGSDGAVSFQMKGAAELQAGEYLVEFFCADPGAPEKWLWLGAHSIHVGQKVS